MAQFYAIVSKGKHECIETW